MIHQTVSHRPTATRLVLTSDMSESELKAVLKRINELDVRIGEKSSADKIWDIVLRTSIPVMLAAIGSSLIWGLSIDKRFSVMESNQFTKFDGANLRRDILEQVPPDWLKTSLADIKAKLIKLEEGK